MNNKRSSKRIDFRLDAEVVLEDSTYKGSIENFSEVGIFKIAVPDEEVVEFMPGANVRVKFQIPTKEIIQLKCSIKWLRVKTEPLAGIIYNMGMEINDPSEEYLKFVQSLYASE